MPTRHQPAIKRLTSNICQHYRLLSLKFAKGKTLDFSADCVVILPTSLWTASIFRQGPDGIFSPVDNIAAGAGGEVTELTYRLSAWDKEAFVYENYRHKIEHKLLLVTTGIARKGAIKLFEKDNLNAVLRTRAFPGAQCLQFVC